MPTAEAVVVVVVVVVSLCRGARGCSVFLLWQSVHPSVWSTSFSIQTGTHHGISLSLLLFEAAWKETAAEDVGPLLHRLIISTGGCSVGLSTSVVAVLVG